jgi:hypothetical protein
MAKANHYSLNEKDARNCSPAPFKPKPKTFFNHSLSLYFLKNALPLPPRGIFNTD